MDAIGSDDPDVLVRWLRDHDYRVTDDMVPLINLHVEEGFAFFDMCLLPNLESQDVQPAKLTYPTERPMIALRLTAVAANPDMSVMAWFNVDRQAVPVNYAKINVADRNLTFSSFNLQSNDRVLMGQQAGAFGGHRFITEYAAPSQELAVVHPLLRELRSRYPYVTRMNTVFQKR